MRRPYGFNDRGLTEAGMDSMRGRTGAAAARSRKRAGGGTPSAIAAAPGAPEHDRTTETGPLALDLTQIRYFLALARTLNFTRAAAQCDVTQPALSRGIQRLEETLGAPLVLRERSLTQLTEFGRAMLPLLQQTHDAAEAARARAEQRRRQQDEAPLRLGLGPYVPLAHLDMPLRQLAERVEGLDLELLRQPEPELIEGLLRGDYDLVIMPETGPLPERLNRWRLWCEDVQALMPPGHALAAESGPLSIEALGGAPVVAACGAVATAALERLREAHGLSVVLRHNGTGPDEVGAVVALGLGLALLPASLAPPLGTHARLLVADPPLRFPVVLLAVAGRPMNRAVAALQRLLRNRAGPERAAA